MAGRAIAEHAKQNGIQYGLRTTLMVMVRIDSTAHYACLGDGGLYHIRGNDGIVTTLFQPQRDKAGYLLASLGPNTAGQPLAGSLHLARETFCFRAQMASGKELLMLQRSLLGWCRACVAHMAMCKLPCKTL